MACLAASITLLIFFLVTSNFRPAENFLSLRLPTTRAQAPEFGKVEPLAIHIFAVPSGCEVRIAQEQAVRIEQATTEENLVVLAETISNIMHDQKRTVDDPVEIICQADVQWQYWAGIYDVLFGMGIKDITIHKAE